MAAGAALSGKNMNGQQITNLGVPANGSTNAARKVDVESAYTAAISRANHVGTQTASTISDFDTQVRTSRLDQLAVPTAPVNFNNQRLTNIADPTTASDAASRNYVDTQLASVASGQTPKGAVRVAAKTNVNLAAPGASVDGVALVAGTDYFLATAQTTGSENGPYVFNGAGVPATRAPNWDTNAEAVLGSYWVVREGTSQDSFALLTTDTTITLGTTATSYTIISVAGAAIGRFAANCPATAAGATWTVAHNLNSTDVHVDIKRVASPFDFVDVYVTTVDANTVSVQPDVALAAGEYRAIVKY